MSRSDFVEAREKMEKLSRAIFEEAIKRRSSVVVEQKMEVQLTTVEKEMECNEKEKVGQEEKPVAQAYLKPSDVVRMKLKNLSDLCSFESEEMQDQVGVTKHPEDASKMADNSFEKKKFEEVLKDIRKRGDSSKTESEQSKHPSIQENPSNDYFFQIRPKNKPKKCIKDESTTSKLSKSSKRHPTCDSSAFWPLHPILTLIIKPILLFFFINPPIISQSKFAFFSPMNRLALICLNKN
ncbi:hypothetical protein B9Z55_002995 [Caenorhabditis nigoni]|uniref:Uncharacterized protein n=1 Tax=Caenorhabditis nigoni TaxID=1611254 RepID=A0A2G5VMY1_9PELO|nr:hypothetical protein B9Z55_002995 [Caenorhabditis nigoni]